VRRYQVWICCFAGIWDSPRIVFEAGWYQDRAEEFSKSCELEGHQAYITYTEEDAPNDYKRID
jgi:hypothetical protein